MLLVENLGELLLLLLILLIANKSAHNRLGMRVDAVGSEGQ